MEEYRGSSVVCVLLSETNYKAWSFEVKQYLLAHDLWDVVARTKPKRGDDQKFRLKVWKRKNAAALHAILISCSQSVRPVIDDIKSARVAWKTLADKCSQLKSVSEHEKEDRADDELPDQTQCLAPDANTASDVPPVQMQDLAAETNIADNVPPDKKQEISTVNAATDSIENSLPANAPNEAGDYRKYEPLFKAVYRGDWSFAKLFIDQHPEAVRVRTPGLGKTALQVAVTEEQVHIVRKLMDIMTEQELEIVRNDGYTVLAAAIEVGHLEIAKCLVRKNKRLVGIIQQAYGIPVVHAVVTGQNHMVHFLYSATPFNDLVLPNEGRPGANLLSQCIFVQHFDIALHLLKRAPFLAITDDAPGKSPVTALAHSKVFPSGCPLKFWQQWIYNCVPVLDSATYYSPIDIQNYEDSQRFKQIKCLGIFIRCKEVLLAPLRWAWSYILDLLDIKRICKMKLFHVQSSELLTRMCEVIEDTADELKVRKAGVHDALISAVYAGNVEFISGMAKANPTLVWNPYIARRVFEVAVEHRQAKIFSLIYGLQNKTAMVAYRDQTNTNMLHKAAAVAPSRLLKVIPGAALQMQRELQWFKAVEELATPAAREWTNKEYLKPRDLFTEKHKDLVVEGEKWMKDTASASTIVGALIVTITFAAAFTFPGGNDQNHGYPMFLDKKLYKVFMMSNAVALFTSTTSVLMFLGILTSRYGEEDFLKSLPKKLIIGLSTLFLSIAAMIIAFCAGFSLMFHNKLWVVVPSISLACIPISFFILMQFPLLVDIFLSTYGPSIFDKNLKRWI